MYDENDLIYSPLQQRITLYGRSVDIHVYRMPDTGWPLEVVDENNGSAVWDGEFEPDQEALDTALTDIAEDGIEAFIGTGPNDHTH